MTTDERDTLRERIAVAVLRYEMDEPHCDEESPYYPEIAVETFREWLASEHFGDCTHEPNSCRRCFADHVHHKAGFIAAALRESEARRARIEAYREAAELAEDTRRFHVDRKGPGVEAAAHIARKLRQRADELEAGQ